MSVDIWQRVDAYCKSGDIVGAASYLEKLLRDCKTDRFVSLADQRLTNSPQAVLDHINKFISACQSQFDVQSVYLEMNGFSNNYGLWYFDSFAYDTYSNNNDDLDWLCDWKSPQWEFVPLHGLESTQDDFRWYMENRIWKQKTHESEMEIAMLLVMVRFLALIQSALLAGQLVVPVRVLATAHDFDSIGRFEPAMRVPPPAIE